MKKIISLSIVLMLVFAVASAEQMAVVISDDTGALVFTDSALEVTDVNADGKLTVYDAIYAAHELGYEGGAAAGLAAEDQGYGLSLTKLWGIENGGSYGYYVNDVSAMSLDDEVAESAYIRVYAYTDLQNWSDTYACFDVNRVELSSRESLKLTLTSVDWEGNSTTVAGAEITIDGEAIGILTDENGAAEITFDQSGDHIVSAVTDTITMVAPVCFVNVG